MKFRTTETRTQAQGHVEAPLHLSLWLTDAGKCNAARKKMPSLLFWNKKRSNKQKTCKLLTRETGLSSLRLKETMPDGSEPSFFVRDARVTLEDSSS
jgi:hypothetical protein